MLFTLLALAHATAQRRYGPVYVDARGQTYEITKPTLANRRAGKWKGRGEPIDLVKFVVPRGWTQERPDGRQVTLVAPWHRTGWAPVVTITVIRAPGDVEAHYADLQERAKERPSAKVFGGGVRQRSDGVKAAVIGYSYSEKDVEIREEEAVFAVDDQHVVWLRSLCPQAIYAEYAELVNHVYKSVRSVRRHDVKPVILPQVKPQF